MKKRPATSKKKVGFALKGTKIEAPDDFPEKPKAQLK
jgi:hypothetical protein